MFFESDEMALCREEKRKHERRVDPALEAYISKNYIEERPQASAARFSAKGMLGAAAGAAAKASFDTCEMRAAAPTAAKPETFMAECMVMDQMVCDEAAALPLDFESEHESKLQERMKHLSDTFSQYLMYLIEFKGMENAEVYKRAIVDKKIFSKIKNNADYHPQKLTALCLCVGAKLNLDETKDLLARAGYALSPCDKTDIIFSYFIENGIYDMIELDIQLEEHGLPCLIS
ncbi:MAG: hypothetical protein K6B44_04805 [Lachnospiraceae bacterium]|nr:hypothetical protein [Lachnospiraceae bacterium]